MQEFRNVTELKKEILSNPALQEQFRTDPVTAAKNIKENKLPLAATTTGRF